MRTRYLLHSIPYLLSIAAVLLASMTRARAQQPAAASDLPLQLATGQYVTPTAPAGAKQQLLNPGLPAYPNFGAGEAVRSQLSPDGKTLAVLCAGQNSLALPDGTTDEVNSTQYIFLYDVTGRHRAAPLLQQVIPQTNAHVGLVFSSDGNTLYATGGRDDVVYAYGKKGPTWALLRTIALGHGELGIGVEVAPNASGLALSADNKTLVVANNYNDSISVIDTATGTVRYEHDLRPWFAGNEGTSAGVGGTFPFAVAIKGNDTAYVSSVRDRELVVIDIRAADAGKLLTRIKLDGSPLGLTFDASGSKLFVAQDNADQVALIDTESNAIVTKIDARAPAGLLPGDEPDENYHGLIRRARYTGAGTFGVTLSPDGKTLYAVNAGANSIAVIPLEGEQANRVVGLIPTAYEPHDITFSADGLYMYIVNGKSITGPNPNHLAGNTAAITSIMYPGGNKAAAGASKGSNQYQFQLERATLVSAPVPSSAELDRLTRKVAENNFYGHGPSEDRRVMRFLRDRIKHVIYIIKENRTFDQVLGDLGNGSDGDSSLVQFGESLTPNFHRIARQFVTLDNFNDPGDGSMDGWSWGLQGRVTNTEALTQQINYSFVDRGLSYESEGTNRNVPVNLVSVAERDAASGAPGTTVFSDATTSLPGGTINVLTGTGNHASSDAPFGLQGGYIFSAVLQAGKTVRNYGFLTNNIGDIGTIEAPIRDAYAAGVVQVAVLEPSLVPVSDVYFRGYDQNYPDLWLYNEWKREFDQYVAQGDLPSLSLVRFGHDHMGSFATALAGVNTPETQQADNDLATGLLVQAVSQSPYADDTLIIITEDDCQDGPDHVDSHRATAYVVGPYVRTEEVVSTHYSQVSVLRTIEDILGTQHINLNTASQRPLTDVFDIHGSRDWSYSAVASTVLQSTQLPQASGGLGGAAYAQGKIVKPKHDAQYWAKLTAAFDFSGADRVPTGRFNRVLWKGLMGNKPYPARMGAPLLARADADD